MICRCRAGSRAKHAARGYGVRGGCAWCARAHLIVHLAAAGLQVCGQGDGGRKDEGEGEGEGAGRTEAKLLESLLEAALLEDGADCLVGVCL